MMQQLSTAVTIVLLSLSLAATMIQAATFDTNFVELDSSKMISTGDANYAIGNHSGLQANWRSVSVNGDEVTIATKDNQVLMKRFQTLSTDEKNNLENVKSILTSVIRLGPFNVKSQTGLARLTTWDRNGGTSSMGSGGSSSSSSSSSSSAGSSGGMSISRTGKDSFVVSKTDFPFNWQRVFVNEDLVTIVYNDARVVMLPQNNMRPDEKTKLIELRQEVEKSAKAAEKTLSTFTSNFKNPMDFVNKAFGGMFG